RTGHIARSTLRRIHPKIDPPRRLGGRSLLAARGGASRGGSDPPRVFTFVRGTAPRFLKIGEGLRFPLLSREKPSNFTSKPMLLGEILRRRATRPSIFEGRDL